MASENVGAPVLQYLGGTEAVELRAEAKEGNLAALRSYLTRSRAQCDWQDRLFMLGLVIPVLRVETLNFLSEQEPETADLALLRCAYFSHRAWKMRGHGKADEVGEVGFEAAAACVQLALEALKKSNVLDPEDPTPHANVLSALGIFGSLNSIFEASFRRVEMLAPGLVPAHRIVVNRLSKRWGGSNELSLEFARNALKKALPGSDMAHCLFFGHTLVRTHFEGFDGNPEAAEEYARKKEVRQELEEAFDQWTRSPYQPRRSSVAYLHQAAAWFYRVQDRERLRRSLTMVGNTYTSAPRCGMGKASHVYASAVKSAFGETAEQAVLQDTLDECFAFVVHGARATARGELEQAEKCFARAMRFAQGAEPEQCALLIPMVELHQSQLRRLQNRSDESKKLREQATQQLECVSGDEMPAKIYRRVATVLMEMDDFRRAIPHWERAIRLAAEDTKPITMAEMLHKMGECYCRTGMGDHGAIPLQAALRIYRENPGDPRLAWILLTLGNALRISVPSEAEALFNEAADLYMAKLQYESATSAWVNLGILCSEQGRHEESLRHYEQVLRVREQSPGTPPAAVARVLNNLANCYQRMGRFEEAHASVDRAMQILGCEDPLIAFMYGTKGRIYLAAGDDAEAVEWLRFTRAEREKQSSPNLDMWAEEFEGEIAALERLGRIAEADRARDGLAKVREAMEGIPQADQSIVGKMGPAEGAVLVELKCKVLRRSEWFEEINLLARRLAKRVLGEDPGRFGGSAAIPESMTLIFFGVDAEKTIAVLEPAIREEPLCAGARVTVQQNGKQREILLHDAGVRVN